MTATTDEHVPSEAPARAGLPGTGTPAGRWWHRRGASRPALPAVLRARRRRLLLVSAPFVVLLTFIALRLLTLNPVHAQTLDGYRDGDKPRALTWAERQGWVNVVERFRHPFAIGDSHVLSGHFDQARPWFEKAFELVPKGGIEECKVRVNLGLTYEALGDAAKARERTDEWRQFYDKGIEITEGRPKLCDAPEGQGTGKQLQDANQRMQQKSTEGQEPGGEQPPTEPQATPQTPDPQADEENTPSEQEQDRLKQQQRQNTAERNEQRGNDDRSLPDGGTDTYPKPW